MSSVGFIYSFCFSCLVKDLNLSQITSLAGELKQTAK